MRHKNGFHNGRRRLRVLTGSARLLGDGQGDLCEGKDVDLWAVLGGGRGQGRQVRLVLLSLSVVKLLVQRRIRRLVRDALGRPRGTAAQRRKALGAPRGTPTQLHTGHHTSCAESCESSKRGGRGPLCVHPICHKAFILPHEKAKDFIKL